MNAPFLLWSVLKYPTNNRFIVPIDIVAVLRREGRLKAGEIIERLQVSRPTLMRAVTAAGDRVIHRGAARRSAYAARRALRGSVSALPVYRVDAGGLPRQIARLDLLHPNGSALDYLEDLGWPLDQDMADGWFEGLPYLLHDMRPQGFIGRAFARRHAQLLQVDENPGNWSDDDALHALALLGSDTPGDLIVGEPACQLWLEEIEKARTDQDSTALEDSELDEAYPYLASHAMDLGFAVSSAGGEFPKFTALRCDRNGTPLRHVIVKFAGNDESPGTRRWSDLLVCEQLAGVVLARELGVRAATSRIHRIHERSYLEIERFDRHGRLGRSGMASWFALNTAFFGDLNRPWTEGANKLREQGWIDADEARRMAHIWHFGQLIANTDMHDGNLSFQSSGSSREARLTVAPVYDMLPMLYAPQRGVEIPTRAYAPKLPLPAQREPWQQAAQAAVAFWQAAAGDERISAGFRETCEANEAHLRSLIG